MITVKNLYYLLLYAWDFFEPDRMADIDAEPETDLLSLLASVLNRGIDQLLRRGVDRGYMARLEDIPGIKGKLHLSATIKGNLLIRGRTVCQFDELNQNVLHNRILKTTLRQLLQTSGLDPRLREPLRNTFFRFAEVKEIPLTGRTFEMVQLHRNIRFYRFLLHVCRLLFNGLIPDEVTGQYRFQDIRRNKKRMNLLFEKFLRNFFEHEQTELTPSIRHYAWANTSGNTSEAQELLPSLNPDICLVAGGRTVILDAKYYRESLQKHPSGRLSVHSGNLYQMFSYLKNVPEVSSNETIEGILVYPLANRRLDFKYSFHGHPLRVYTIDLRQHWSGIHRDLLGLLKKGAE